MSSLPLRPKKFLNFWELQKKNVDKVFGIPMSSVGDVHLIFEIAHLKNAHHFFNMLVISTTEGVRISCVSAQWVNPFEMYTPLWKTSIFFRG